jgi:hypothetical protein
MVLLPNRSQPLHFIFLTVQCLKGYKLLSPRYVILFVLPFLSADIPLSATPKCLQSSVFPRCKKPRQTTQHFKFVHWRPSPYIFRQRTGRQKRSKFNATTILRIQVLLTRLCLFVCDLNAGRGSGSLVSAYVYSLANVCLPVSFRLIATAKQGNGVNVCAERNLVSCLNVRTSDIGC